MEFVELKWNFWDFLGILKIIKGFWNFWTKMEFLEIFVKLLELRNRIIGTKMEISELKLTFLNWIWILRNYNETIGI